MVVQAQAVVVQALAVPAKAIPVQAQPGEYAAPVAGVVPGQAAGSGAFVSCTATRKNRLLTFAMYAVLGDV